MTRASEQQVGGDHYRTLPIQPIHYIRRNNLGWYEGNIVKYVTRHKQKGQVEDIKKVIHYANLILEEYEDNERVKDVAPSDSSADSTGPVREGGAVPPEFRSVRGYGGDLFIGSGQGALLPDEGP